MNAKYNFLFFSRAHDRSKGKTQKSAKAYSCGKFTQSRTRRNSSNRCFYSNAPLRASSETQGQIVGARESLNRRKNMAQKESKERREEPLGTLSYQTSSKRSPPFCLLIGARKLVFFWHQSEARTAATVWNWSGKTLSQGLFSPFFTFRRAIFFRPFRLSLAPTICPWVSEDDMNLVL